MLAIIIGLLLCFCAEATFYFFRTNLFLSVRLVNITNSKMVLTHYSEKRVRFMWVSMCRKNIFISEMQSNPNCSNNGSAILMQNLVQMYPDKDALNIVKY